MIEPDWNTTDPVLGFPVVTVEGFPHGLRCAECGRTLTVGDPFKSVEQAMYGDGDVIALIVCVYCP